MSNVVYQWVLKSNNPTNLIYIPESDVRNIVTAKQSIYIFAGLRGKIYISNGSAADLFAKVPDHISGTVQPQLGWGAAIYHQNQLYFGVFNGTSNPFGSNKYGGIWGLDIDTGAMYLQNVLSDGSYAGYVPLLGKMGEGEFAGYGLYAGWWDSSLSSGLDVSVSTPYTGGQSIIVSDLIPVGTLLAPMTASQVEFKTSMPLATGESVQLQMASSLYDYANGNFTNLGTTVGSAPPYTTSDGTNPQILSGNFPITVQKQQWLLVKTILTSKATTPTYCRLTQLRVKGDTIKTQVAGQPYATQ
jgi:hypothetical protein